MMEYLCSLKKETFLEVIQIYKQIKLKGIRKRKSGFIVKVTSPKVRSKKIRPDKPAGSKNGIRIMKQIKRKPRVLYRITAYEI